MGNVVLFREVGADERSPGASRPAIVSGCFEDIDNYEKFVRALAGRAGRGRPCPGPRRSSERRGSGNSREQATAAGRYQVVQEKGCGHFSKNMITSLNIVILSFSLRCSIKSR